MNAERTHLSVRPLSRTSEKEKNLLDTKGDKNKNVEIQNLVGDSIYSAAFSVWCNTQKVLSEGFEAIYDALERRTYAIDIVRTPGSHTHVLCGVCAALHRGSNRGQTGFRALFFQILPDENAIIENKKKRQNMNMNQSDSEDKNESEIGNDDACENKNDNDNDIEKEKEKELGILKLQDIINFLETIKSTHLSDNVVQIFTQNDLENFGPKNDYPTHTLFGSKIVSFEYHFSKSIIAFSLFKLCRSLIAVILMNKNSQTDIEKLNSTVNQCDLNISNVDNHGIIVNLVMDCVFTDLNAIFNSKYYYTDIENNDSNPNNNNKNDNNNNEDDNDNSNNYDTCADTANTNFNTNKNFEKSKKSKNLESVLNSTFSGIFLPFLSILHTQNKSVKAVKLFLPHSIRFLDFFRQIFSPQNNGFDNESKPNDSFHGFQLHWVMKEWLEDMMKWVRKFASILLVLTVFLLLLI